MRVRRKSAGFTLIEMVIVISIMGVLLALAVPMYNQSVLRAKEARLHYNVAKLNEIIQQYSLDKKKAPQTLDDLVQAGYFKFIPDDITGSKDTWKPEPEDPQNAANPDETGIGLVHSGSDEISSDGSPYSSWTH
jgi:general secretion pathway protein G